MPTLARLSLFAIASSVVACGGSLATPSDAGAPDGNAHGDGGTVGPGDDASGPPTADGSTPIGTINGEKVDILFMIDNSAGMSDKQALLAASVPDFLARLTQPRCVDPNDGTTVLGGSQPDGTCAAGVVEFNPVHDLHIGIVTSALGGRGSDACDATVRNPVHSSLLTHNDDRGHLINRVADNEAANADAAPTTFLTWFPSVSANAGRPTPPIPLGDSARLAADFSDMVNGVHEYGCGFEAQLESWYRFLVQPDPYMSISGGAGAKASLVGIDDALLQQRHDFLRPDSILAIVLLTDENDSTVDPLSIGGQGWAFENSSFPGSKTGGGAARATSQCATNPLDSACTSCGFGQTPNDPSCLKNGGYYDPATEDPLNERFFHMKQRFGVDPQFPLTRYINALTSARVPDQKGEHPSGAANYVGTNDCTNPIFAGSLPTSSSSELCNLPPGPRGANDVFFTVIAGVPSSLLAVDPANPLSAQKVTLTSDDWRRVLGSDPLNYDFTGADPHMLESLTPRAGLAPPTSSSTADPISGREWDTAGYDLQYACIFTLPAPKDCTDPKNVNACDCIANRSNSPPVCDTAVRTLQTRGKATPAIRELSVVRALGGQGIASSICPVHAVESTPGDPLFAYRPAFDALVSRMRTVLPRGAAK